MDDPESVNRKSAQQDVEELAEEALKRHLAFSDYKARETYRCLLEWSNEQARRFDHWLLWLNSGGIVVSLYMLKETHLSGIGSWYSWLVVAIGIAFYLASIVFALVNLLRAQTILQYDAQKVAGYYEKHLELAIRNQGAEIRMPGKETEEDKKTRWVNCTSLVLFVLGSLALTCSIFLCVLSPRL